MEVRIERVGDTADDLGESPLWCGCSRRLFWVDGRRGILRRLDPETGAREDHVLPASLGALALTRDPGRVVVALRDRVALYDLAARAWRDLARLEFAAPAVRLNDAIADPGGGFIFGTMHTGRAPGEPPEGGLFRLSPEGVLRRIGPAMGVMNGPCFSPDGTRFFVTDSPSRRILSYTLDSEGIPRAPQVHVDLEGRGMVADGMTVDAAGNLWCALVTPGALACFGPGGDLLRLLEMPVKHPTSVMFGGAGLDVLYVTSIRDSGRLTDSHPDAGGLFRVTGLGAVGRSEHRAAF